MIPASHSGNSMIMVAMIFEYSCRAERSLSGWRNQLSEKRELGTGKLDM